MRSFRAAGGVMTDAAWAFLTAVFLALFGAGGYFQWRRTTKKLDDKVAPATENAAQAKAKIDTLLPIVIELQRRLSEYEDAQIELIIQVNAHNEWDRRVLEIVRRMEPGFPDPPPLIVKRREVE